MESVTDFFMPLIDSLTIFNWYIIIFTYAPRRIRSLSIIKKRTDSGEKHLHLTCMRF